jgi:hypothetical protein
MLSIRTHNGRWCGGAPVLSTTIPCAIDATLAIKVRVLEPCGAMDVLSSPGHLVLPAFPLCIGRNLVDGLELSPARFFVRRPLVDQATKNPGSRRG